MAIPFVQVMRYGFGKNSTLGWISTWENDKFVRRCFSLEDERRHTKVYGETCIPTGTYPLALRTEGEMHERYLRRFGDRHKGMLWIQDVPEFEWTYFHILNYEWQTKGCIGTGKVPGVYPDGEFFVGRSEAAYLDLYDIVAPRLIAGERVMCYVTETQPWA